jgi:hypothetical protein
MIFYDAGSCDPVLSVARELRLSMRAKGEAAISPMCPSQLKM